MENIIELVNIDFGSVNDEFNWITSGSTPIETTNGQLKLTPDDQTTSFSRGLGDLDASNDRVVIDINLDLYRPQTSQHDKMNVVFGVFAGSQLIDQFTLSETAMDSGTVVTHNFRRVYKYADLSGPVSLKITVPIGFQNQLFLDSLLAINGQFTETNVRTFFAFDDFFEQAIGSVSSAVQLLEWKIGGVETLTQLFFDENNSPGGDPDVDWLLAKADIDGSNRVADTQDPNTWNPFVTEFGLTFENVAGNYHGGKPTAVTSGSDYGSGIMSIGLSKPSMLNGNLENKNGAFFIDIDFSKSLKVVFNVLVNNTNVNPFDSPAWFRKYTIEWNADTCSARFFYQDQLATDTNKIHPDDQNGFLSGITAGLRLTEIVGCDQSFAYNGNAGTFEFQIDFGSEIGECGINYDAFSIPDKFDIEWNGEIFTTGFVGHSDYDQQLINEGIPQTDINTGDPSTGAGQLTFNKTLASPASAIVRVHAPLGSTGWNISGICPNGVIKVAPTVDITTSKPDYTVNETITVNITASDDVGIASWVIDYGDGTTESGTGTPPATLSKTYPSNGTRTIKMTVTDGDGLTGTDSLSVDVFTDSNYTISGSTIADCDTAMDATVTVNDGVITMNHFWKPISGNPDKEANTISIYQSDGTTLITTIASGESYSAGPGTYVAKCPPLDCSLGSAVVRLLIS